MRASSEGMCFVSSIVFWINSSKVATAVNNFKLKGAGELYIKRMPESTTTANHIRAYLKEFEQTKGFKPDIIIVDYLDINFNNVIL